MQRTILRTVAVFLLACFLTQDLAWAAPEVVVWKNSPEFSVDPSKFHLSPEWGKISESHRGNSPKSLIHIQDAHANLGAQQNLAKLVEELITRYGVSTVFVEGGTRDDSLTPLRSLAPKI